MNRVLLVDDEPGLLRALGMALRASGWRVTTAADGRSALRAHEHERADVVVLDLGLPDMDGVEVLTTLRRSGDVPVLVLSARDQSADKVRALDAGADDFVTKPFELQELLARLRAAIRRRDPATEPPLILSAGDLTIDLGRKQVQRSGADVPLTPTEWNLLEVLVRRRGRLVSHQHLLQEVWGPAYGTETNYLRVYTAQLRRKLEHDPARPRHILSSPGLGYRFES